MLDPMLGTKIYITTALNIGNHLIVTNLTEISLIVISHSMKIYVKPILIREVERSK